MFLRFQVDIEKVDGKEEAKKSKRAKEERKRANIVSVDCAVYAYWYGNHLLNIFLEYYNYSI